MGEWWEGLRNAGGVLGTPRNRGMWSSNMSLGDISEWEDSPVFQPEFPEEMYLGLLRSHGGIGTTSPIICPLL